MESLVTGSHGFIGSHLVKVLQTRGDEVKTISIRSGDISLDPNFGTLNPQYIFHLSAYGNMSQQTDNEEIIRANYTNLYCLLDWLKDIPYKAFVNVSTSSVTLPHQTMYSATKRAGEALCRAFVDEYHKPIVSFRPYSVYGPGEADFRFIPTVFRSCLKGEPMTLADGSHDWVYIDDVVRELINVSYMAKSTSMTTFECGTGRTTSNGQVVYMIERITGKKANIQEEKKLRSFDTDKWVAASINPAYYPLQYGLEKYYEWYKENEK